MKTDPTPTKEQLAERLALAAIDLEQAQHAFLRGTGWKHSSSHPDCHWRWSKEFEYEGEARMYHLSKTSALRMEQTGIFG